MAVYPQRTIKKESGARFILSLIGLSFFQAWPANVAPILNGSIMSGLALKEGAVGYIASADALGFAIFLISSTVFLKHFGVKTIAISGLLLCTAANGASAYVSEPNALAGLRFLAGSGAGIAASSGFVVLAMAVNIERSASILAIVGSVLTGIAVGLAALVSQTGGTAALFQFCAAVTLIALIPTLLLCKAEKVKSNVPLSIGWSPNAILLILASALTLAGSVAVWTFAERIGVSAGLAIAEVGQILALTTIAGIFGGGASYALSDHRRPLTYLIIGFFCFSLASAGLAMSGTGASFIVTMLILTFSFVFYQPFLTATACQIDPSGVLAARALGCSGLAAAVSPIAAGITAEHLGLKALALFPLLTMVMAICALVAIATDLRKKASNAVPT